VRALGRLAYRHPQTLLAGLLVLPLLWFAAFYLLPIATLLQQSLFALDDYSGRVVRDYTLRSYIALLEPANRDIVLRTLAMATAVTIAAALLALPLAWYMSFRAGARTKMLLYLAVVVPLWSSYLVRVYAWKLILAREGIVSYTASALHLDWALDALLATPVIGGPSLSLSSFGMFCAFLYVWLPFMILPIQTALERVPRSLLEASGDLGATPAATFRHVVLPLALPGVIAGSIFTFSLTLGDFVIPSVLGNSSFFIGQAVLSHQGTSGNLPLAAAFTMVPIAIMAVYLAAARRMRAFDAL
jgi:putative spermidine/putrescine transport system permease protein